MLKSLCSRTPCGDQADGADGGDPRECEHDAAELRQHTGDRQRDPLGGSGPAEIGLVRQQGAEEGTDQGGARGEDEQALSADSAASLLSARMLAVVKAPVSASWKAPIATVTVGTIKKIVRNKKNGTSGSSRPRSPLTTILDRTAARSSSSM